MTGEWAHVPARCAGPSPYRGAKIFDLSKRADADIIIFIDGGLAWTNAVERRRSETG